MIILIGNQIRNNFRCGAAVLINRNTCQDFSEIKMKKSSFRVGKIIKNMKNRFTKKGSRQSENFPKSPKPERNTLRSVSTPRLLASFSPAREDPDKWRQQIDNACSMYENYRLHKATQNIGELRRQSRIYREELSEMKNQISKLKNERERLSRALETTKVPSRISRPAYGDRQYFMKYERATRLNVTPVKSVSSPSLRSKVVKSPSSERDSAYMSAASSPEKNELPKPKFLNRYMSNGTNTYFLAV